MNSSPVPASRQEYPRRDLRNLVAYALFVQTITSCSFKNGQHVLITQIRRLVVPHYSLHVYKSRGIHFRTMCKCQTNNPINLRYEVYEPAIILHRQPQHAYRYVPAIQERDPLA
jgi:hypothetical protein